MLIVRTTKALISDVPRIVSIDVNVVVQGYELFSYDVRNE
jgi:hypothetical protein